MKKARVRFWGVRGAIARPGAATAGVGGNTSCVEVRWGKTLLILDAGTGICPLGEALVREQQPVRGTILFSHVHLDHTIGLPFFAPLYNPKNHFWLLGPQLAQRSFRAALTHVFRPPSFPVRLTSLAARMYFRTVRLRPFTIQALDVIPFPLHHPGGVFGYRIFFPNGRSVVYATDSEPKSVRHTRALIEWCCGADLLIHDAHYTPREYERKIGWGHSPYTFVLRVAHAAGVRRVALFHHSPNRDDRAFVPFLSDARRCVRTEGWNVRCDLAIEGKEMIL